MIRAHIPYSSRNLHTKFYTCLLFVLGWVLCSHFTNAQYPNLGFENGNFSGWNGFTGQCCPVYLTGSGINLQSHQLTNGSGSDAYTLGAVAVVAPGSTYSAKLGNDSANSEAERLSYTFTVSAQAPLIVYRYAVVFQFPINHPPTKQPRFEAMVTNAANDTLACTLFSEVAANTIEGFNPINEIRYKNWTDAAIDLSDYVGQTVTLQFSTGDCGMGGHFGYAYIDAYAAKMQITDSVCDANGNISLSAPPGFNSYQWSTGDTLRQIILSNVKAGDVISINLLSTTGCEYQLQYVVPDFVPACAITTTQLCNSKFYIEGASAVSGSVIDSAIFIFDNQISALNSFEYDFGNAGNYTLTYMAYAANNCVGTATVNINAYKSLFANFNFDKTICPSQPVHFYDASLSTTDNINNYRWSAFGSDFSDSPNAQTLFATSGNYNVQLVIESNFGCTDTAIKQVTVLSANDCGNMQPLYFPTSFSPNGDGKNDTYVINSPNGETILIKIFNRWGQLVFKQYGNKILWDGLNTSREAIEQGIYPAVITVENTKTSYTKTVNVALVK